MQEMIAVDVKPLLAARKPAAAAAFRMKAPGTA
jgi:hypothetical protein